MSEYFVFKYSNLNEYFSKTVNLDENEEEFVTWVDVVDNFLGFISTCYGYQITPADYMKRKLDEVDD